MYISLFSPPTLGSQSFNALNIFGLFASLSINKFIFEGSTPSALMAYSLKAFASLLANAASKFTRYSYFSTPIIIAILFLSLPVLFNYNSIKNIIEKKISSEFKINLKILDNVSLKLDSGIK